MNYLKSENLKFKSTINNRLLWIAPLITTLFAWFVGGFYGFQYMSFYWWYAFLFSGTIAILTALSHQKEEKARNYYSIVSLNINLEKFQLSKNIIIVLKLIITTLFLILFVSVSNFISPATAVYSISTILIGGLCVCLSSIWQIPLCFYFIRKTGMAFVIGANSLLAIFSPIIFGNTFFWFLNPYCWTAKLAEPALGILLNGTYTGNISYSWLIIIIILMSLLLFFILAILDSKTFSKKCIK